MSTPEIEDRKCKCGNTFRVYFKSKQKTCRATCLGIPLPKANPCEKNTIGKTQRPLERKKEHGTSGTLSTIGVKNESGEIVTLNEYEPRKEPLTIDAPKPKPKLWREEEIGQLRTKSGSLPTNEPITTNIKSNVRSESMQTESALVHSTDSKSPSTTLDGTESPSMHLLDASCEHIYSLMKGLTANAPDVNVRAYSPEIVNTACLCAKNIREIMKLKVEVMKIKLGK